MSVKKAGFGCHPDYLDMTNKRKPVPHKALPSEYEKGLHLGREPGKGPRIVGPTGSAHYKRREH